MTTSPSGPIAATSPTSTHAARAAAAPTPAAARIASLRQAMQHHGLAAWIVPSSDPHLSEYLPERWQGRAWLSGFTGSAGTLVVASRFAGVWVDSRYWLQADSELAGSGITPIRVSSNAAGAFIDWLRANCGPGDVVGVDGRTLGLSTERSVQEALAGCGATLRTDLDLLDEVWTSRPGLPRKPVFESLPQFTPIARAAKLARVRDAMRQAGTDWHLVSTLDDIAWLLNLRGSDVSYNPVFLAHLLIGPQGATLFVTDGKIPPALQATLQADGVRLAGYEQLAGELAQLPAGGAILIDPRRVTFGILQALPASMRRVERINPSTLAKAVKSDGEIALIRSAMEQDGAALCEFFAWLEQALTRCEVVSELTIDEKLTQARARRTDYFSDSFSTIAGFNANGAMPHYRATAASHAVVCDGRTSGDGLLLIDSGGQYHTGTTDITRVTAVGSTTEEQRADFTRVLKGMIALSRARFPQGTRSPMLDSLARAPIWAAGAEYGHGTGHGVGFFLNVHEGPHGITPYLLAEPHTALEPGMITSNEPGIYRPGRWGVRIENLVLTVPAEKTEFGNFLEFETLTLCPIDARCIERSLLDPTEIDWLNRYHAMVRARLALHVTGAAAKWLEANTRPI
ncbi:MAG: aminopeptidase P family protein [Burkholderiaceae bacterium]|nr:aminopeptidase P family protein [Burkholderiaceae bacterium]